MIIIIIININHNEVKKVESGFTFMLNVNSFCDSLGVSNLWMLLVNMHF